MNPTFVVLAAGRGSRYRGLKQVDAIGLADEGLMDYSPYDAIKASVKVLKTEAKWFGITYPDDKANVRANIRKLVDDGIYPDNVRF